MQTHWTHARWRHWRQQRPLGWGERLVLIALAIAAVPVALALFAALFLIAVGLGTIVLIAWLIGRLLRPRRMQPASPTVITTDYARLSEERERPAGRNPWTRP